MLESRGHRPGAYPAVGLHFSIVDAAGMVYVTGSTVSADFPKTANAFSTKLGGAKNTSDVYNQDAFVVKINPSSPSGADSLMFSSFLGGSGLDAPTALSFDRTGKLLVTGYAASPDMDPLVSTTLQPANRGGYDAFSCDISDALRPVTGNPFSPTYVYVPVDPGKRRASSSSAAKPPPRAQSGALTHVSATDGEPAP